MTKYQLPKNPDIVTPENPDRTTDGMIIDPHCPQCKGTGEIPHPWAFKKFTACPRCEARQDPRAWARIRVPEIEKELTEQLIQINRQRTGKTKSRAHAHLFAEFAEKWIHHPLVIEYRILLRCAWM